MTRADWSRRGPVGGGASAAAGKRRRHGATGSIVAGVALPIGSTFSPAGGLPRAVNDAARPLAGLSVLALVLLAGLVLAGLVLARRRRLSRAAEDAARRAAMDAGRRSIVDTTPRSVEARSAAVEARPAARRRRHAAARPDHGGVPVPAASPISEFSPVPEPGVSRATTQDPLVAAMQVRAGTMRPPVRPRAAEGGEAGQHAGPRRRVAPPSTTRPSAVPPPGRQANWVARLDTRTDPRGPRADPLEEDERAAG